MQDILMQQIKDQVSRLGVTELNTPADVDNLLKGRKGTVLIFVNSVCGCAGGIARPGLQLAMKHRVLPDMIATVFASSEIEATMHARSYFTGMPSSSPSFAILRDGRLVHMIHRSDIEIREPEEVAALLTASFAGHCLKETKN